MMIFLAGLNYEALAILVVMVLVVLNIVLISLAISKFKRARLIFV